MYTVSDLAYRWLWLKIKMHWGWQMHCIVYQITCTPDIWINSFDNRSFWSSINYNVFIATKKWLCTLHFISSLYAYMWLFVAENQAACGTGDISCQSRLLGDDGDLSGCYSILIYIKKHDSWRYPFTKLWIETIAREWLNKSVSSIRVSSAGGKSEFP